MRRPTRLIRDLVALLFSFVLVPVLLLGAAPVSAASTTADPTPKARPQLPASAASMDLYMRLSAINFCLARSIGQLDVAKAIPVAGETVVVILQNEHGSKIQQVGDKPLSLEELRRGAYDSVLLGALTFCPKDIPDDVRQSLEAALKAQVALAGDAASSGSLADAAPKLPIATVSAPPAPSAQSAPSVPSATSAAVAAAVGS